MMTRFDYLYTAFYIDLILKVEWIVFLKRNLSLSRKYVGIILDKVK